MILEANRTIFLGSDPEVFVRDGGNLLPAFEFLPDKKNPIHFEPPTTYATRKANLYADAFWDGFQAEFGMKESPCVAWVVDAIRAGLLTVQTEAQKYRPTAKLTSQNVFQIPVATLKASKDEYVMLGCEPSLNTYGMAGKHVMNARKLRYRFAGGHIHFEIADEFHPLKRELGERIIRELDMVLGVWSVGAAASIDNPIRREYYGLAGEFRLPKHGLEYRTLSNFWHVHPGISNLVLMIARGILQTDLKDWVAHPQETVEIINNCDVQGARKILNQNEGVLRRLFNRAKIWEADHALRIAQHGIETLVKDPEDFSKNWKFDGEWVGHAEGSMEGWDQLSKAQKLAA